jgi:S-adenosylmethionine synthetase
MAVAIRIEAMRDPPPGDRLVEVVERKGIGHPDTICDALAEEVSRALSRHYLDRFERVLHHNVDKILLCGGSATARFGGGEVTAPIEIILAGRATSRWKGVDIPVEALAIESCRSWLRAHLHALDPVRHVHIACRFRPGSGDLLDVYARAAEGRAPRANDTSIGVGFAPLSPVEDTVLDVERWLTDPVGVRARPETGEDVKVMAVRDGDHTRLTVACAFVSAFVGDAAEYAAKKADLAGFVHARAADRLGGPVDVEVNAADDPARGSVYLTVTGTSAEAGDDGEVGRGNRVSGLITPGRPMSLEGAAGKNAVSHAGKLYNVAAALIARDLVSALPEIHASECVLVSRIGAPIDEPQIVSLRLGSAAAALPSPSTPALAEIVESRLRELPALRERLIAGAVPVY